MKTSLTSRSDLYHLYILRQFSRNSILDVVKTFVNFQKKDCEGFISKIVQ